MDNQMQSIPGWETLLKESPYFAEQIDKFATGIFKGSRLDNKTTNLIWIAVNVITDYDLAIKAHIPLALAAGANRDEILGGSCNRM